MQDAGARYPHGKTFRKFSIDDVVDICESAFSYEFALLLAAVKAATAEAADFDADLDGFVERIDLLQKRLKYGLPSQDAISYFEAGFADRVVAQKVVGAVFLDLADSPWRARALVREYANEVQDVLAAYPSYFQEVFQGMQRSSAPE
jgi:hypothetical protein